MFRKHGKTLKKFCAVAKHEHEDGFLITAYQTDAIKEGEQLWHK